VPEREQQVVQVAAVAAGDRTPACTRRRTTAKAVSRNGIASTSAGISSGIDP
jgi:hypothetical protein